MNPKVALTPEPNLLSARAAPSLATAPGATAPRATPALGALLEPERAFSLRVRLPRAATYWTLVALLVRFVGAILIHLYSLAMGYGGFYPLASGADDSTYWPASIDIYNGVGAGYSLNVYPSVLAGYFHLIGGPDLLLGKMLNVVAGALTVGVGVLIVQELTRGRAPEAERRRAAKWAGALLTFYPSLLWYSTQLVKDPILILGVMTALYCQLLFLKRAHLWPIALWVLSLAMAFLFRPYAVAAVAVGLGLFVLRFNRKWLVPVLLVMALVPYGLGMGLFGFNYVQPMIDTERLATVRQQAYAIGGSAAGITVDYSNPFKFVTTFSYSLATAMFGPFPWQIKAMGQAVALPEAIGMWFLIPLWFASLRDLIRSKRSIKRTVRDKNDTRDATLFLFSLVLIGLVSLFSDNIGANTRLRLLPWSAFLLFASIRLAHKKRKVI